MGWGFYSGIWVAGRTLRTELFRVGSEQVLTVFRVATALQRREDGKSLPLKLVRFYPKYLLLFDFGGLNF